MSKHELLSAMVVEAVGLLGEVLRGAFSTVKEQTIMNHISMVKESPRRLLTYSVSSLLVVSPHSSSFSSLPESRPASSYESPCCQVGRLHRGSSLETVCSKGQ